MKFHPAACAAILLVGACSKPEPPPAAAAVQVPDPARIERWLGRWTGPEGTWLEISPDGPSLRVQIADLDGPRTYAGRVAGDGIEFQRDGRTETLRPGSGADTGMKWMAEKKDCLLTAPGEGWCRD